MMSDPRIIAQFRVIEDGAVTALAVMEDDSGTYLHSTADADDATPQPTIHIPAGARAWLAEIMARPPMVGRGNVVQITRRMVGR